MRTRQIGLLVGDNPFHGISHLSQERARIRLNEGAIKEEERPEQLVVTSLKNGADGFMFSVSEITLSVLRAIPREEKPELYAIVPYAYEYARLATSQGGFSGLAKRIMKQIVLSKNVFTVAKDSIGIVNADASKLLKAYLLYEISRIKSAAGKNCNLQSVMLHEILTDMALAFNLDWLFKFYIKFMKSKSIRPGFETRNFSFLTDRFREWKIDLSETAIVAPFNKVGFQMNPSKSSCEESLKHVEGAKIIAMSVLAAGYLKPADAVGYVASLPNISEIVVGVSRNQQATETFKILQQSLNKA